MMFGFPYIAFENGRYQMHCGTCDHADAIVSVVLRTACGNIAQYVCSYCHNKRGEPTPIAGFKDIRSIAERDSNGDRTVFERMVADVEADYISQYEQL